MQGTYSLRKARQEDFGFLITLRDATMREHLERAGYAVNERSLAERVRDAYESAEIVSIDGKDVGLLKVRKEGRVWDLIQIQLFPSLQRRGIGRRLLVGVLEDAKKAGVTVELSVLKGNPAKRLYERLGFRVVGEEATECLMRHDTPQGDA